MNQKTLRDAIQLNTNFAENQLRRLEGAIIALGCVIAREKRHNKNYKPGFVETMLEGFRRQQDEVTMAVRVCADHLSELVNSDVLGVAPKVNKSEVVAMKKWREAKENKDKL